MFSKQHIIAMIIIGLLPALSVNAERRDVKAHQHGRAELNIVISDNNISSEIILPSFDAVGFEHRPKTNEEKQKINKAFAELRRGNKLFLMDTAANCVLADASVEADYGDHEEKKEETAKPVTPEDADHKEHKEHKEKKAEKPKHEGPHHAELHAKYSFQCMDISKLKKLTVDVFHVFKGSEVRVVVVTGSKQIAKTYRFEEKAKSPFEISFK